jgi:drug/metabolite transporter (DMT)-like permease
LRATITRTVNLLSAIAVSTTTLAVFGLILNAMAWGLSWWPFRELQHLGWHPLWSTAVMYGLAVVFISVWRPKAWSSLLHTRGLWLLALGAGLTNVGFNWAVTIGDVVRVVLLFYMMIVWSILLAWLILNERPTASSLMRVAVAIAGVLLVLKTADSPWPIPRSLADWLALAGGFCFALNNAMLRRLRDVPFESRTLAMFVGGSFVSAWVGGVVAFGSPAGSALMALPSALPVMGWLLLIGFGLFFLISNMTLQYGAARLKASTTSLILLTEILFATVSSVALGVSQLDQRIVLGGCLIIAAALWAAWEE